jgi:acylpyruvate hydrolase
MRIASFRAEGSVRVGLIDGDQIIDVQKANPKLAIDLRSGLHSGPSYLAALAAVLKSAGKETRRPLNGLSYAPLIANPGKVICLGLNYYDHAMEGGHPPPEYPAFFLRTATSLIAAGAPVIRPRVSEKLDYEAELAVIVGKGGRHISKASALEHVAGYSCFNDVSVRDYQRRTTQWTVGKNFDDSGPFGPWMVTPDELPPGAAGLTIQSRLNGQVMQNSNTSLMMCDVVNAIFLLSECMTLDAGDVIVMGTPAGVGWARKPPVFMKQGDTIEVEIERIGVLSNPVMNEAG